MTGNTVDLIVLGILAFNLGAVISSVLGADLDRVFSIWVGRGRASPPKSPGPVATPRREGWNSGTARADF